MKGDILETKCPDCGGILSFSDEEEFHGNKELISTCEECKKNWIEVYKMTPYGIKIIYPIGRYFVG